MESGFDSNVATAMPRSGKGAQPKAPWEVTPPPPDIGGRRGFPGGGGGARYPNFERGKSDVLEKIRDLKAELEGSFSAREALQARTEETEDEVRRLRKKNESLHETIEEQRRDASYQKEERETAQKRIKELEDLVERERTSREQLRNELAESRTALDEINAALQ